MMSNFRFFDKENATIAEQKPLVDLKDGGHIDTYDKRARYRSEQQVITKHSGTVASHGILKHEYLLDINKTNEGHDAKVTITDAYGSYEPELMSDLVQLGLLVDSVRHEQKFKLDNSGKPIQLLNKAELINNWMVLRTMQLKDNKLLKNFDSAEQKEILKEVNSYCDVVFSDSYPMLDELYKNLFHFTVFDNYLFSSDFEGKNSDTTQFYSGMFNIPLTMQFQFENFEDKVDTYVFEKNSKLLYADYDLIMDIYKKQYQPALHYAFTDYDYNITSRVEVDKKTNFITQAFVTIKESVKNNIESTISYNLKQVEL